MRVLGFTIIISVPLLLFIGYAFSADLSIPKLHHRVAKVPIPREAPIPLAIGRTPLSSDEKGK